MEVKIESTTMGKVLSVKLNEGESIKAQPGALIMAKGEIEVESSAGGIFSGIMRMAGGESAFINTIRAQGKAELILGNSFPSDIKELKLNGEAYLLGDGAYLAHTGDVEISAKFSGATAFLSGSGLFFQRVAGKGSVYITGEDEILEVELKEGETLYVDNVNFLACPEAMEIEKVFMGKGWKAKLFSGEAFFFKLKGPGRVLVRTSSIAGVAQSISRYIHTR